VTDGEVALGLRPMRWWDLASVHVLEDRLFPTDAWSEAVLWSELAGVPDSRWYVVAVRGEQVVGYAGVSFTPPEADVQTLAVAPEAQREGVGARLLDAVVEHAVARGCRSMLLEVAAANDPARLLYERDGFEVIARRSRYYPDGSDALVMRRALRQEASGG
jgi:ribosomal-protein-alanine N-acetyltransferase